MATAAALGSAAMGQTVSIWSVDPLTKVFKDDKPAPSESLAEVARGEMAEWQVVFTADRPLRPIKVTVTTFRPSDPSAPNLKGPRVRYVGYVPVDRGLPEPPKDRLRTPPCDYPDPLLVDAPAEVPAGIAQTIWLDLQVPKGAAPGEYQAEVRVAAECEGRHVSAKLPIRLKIFDVTVGKSRLWVTNWFHLGNGHMPGSGPLGTPGQSDFLAKLGRSMAGHRQNVAMVSPLALCGFRYDAAGNLMTDFTIFDRWVSILSRAGVIGRIEGGHFGGRSTGDWASPFFITVQVPENGKAVAKSVPPTSPEADRFYSQFLPALVKHLKAKRWWSRYIQHLGDEPYEANLQSYREMATLVRKYAPGIKIIDAIHTKDLDGSVDVWVPQLNWAHTAYDHYKGRQKQGEEFWMYTCVYPQGEYANRFVEQPLIKTRILHWINYRYGMTGYLHWGYNYWVRGDMFKDLTRGQEKDGGWGGYLPAGDSWIVYAKDGALLDSIRSEAMRDGIADYELLSMLGDRDPKAAQELAQKIVLDFDKYKPDIRGFRAVRRELLERLASRGQ